MANSPQESPIEDICIVSDLNRVPPGYFVIRETLDTHEVADLWKDRFFSKIPRYLCYLPATDSGRVLTELRITGDKDPVPPGFTSVDHTKDTYDKALRKKKLCICYAQRCDATNAVCHVVLLSKDRKPPPGYTYIGELDSIALCQKVCPVTPTQSKSEPILANGSANEDLQRIFANYQTQPSPYVPQTQKQPVITGISGVQFQLNSCLQSGASSASFDLPPMKVKTRDDLDKEYTYSFRAERTALQRLPSIAYS